MSTLKNLLTFPVIVNETAARLVAGMVACLSLGVILTGAHGLLPLLAAGFLLRVLAGPRLSPLALLAVRVLVPALRLPVKPVPGTPKRFAQAIGLAVTTLASLLALAAGATGSADALLAVLVVFATLEAALGFCAGCWLFGTLARLGVFREPACVDCAVAPAPPASAPRRELRASR